MHNLEFLDAPARTEKSHGAKRKVASSGSFIRFQVRIQVMQIEITTPPGGQNFVL